LITAGAGTFGPRTTAGQMLTVVWGFVGIGVFGFCLSVFGNVMDEQLLDRVARILARRKLALDNCFASRRSKDQPPSQQSENEEEDIVAVKELEASAAQLRVKSYITIGLSVFVWLFSAVAFQAVQNETHDPSLNETPWTFMEALYYVGVTFLTIGLGDFSISWEGDRAWLRVTTFVLLTTLGLVLFAVLVQLGLAAIKNGVQKVMVMQQNAQRIARAKAAKAVGALQSNRDKKASVKVAAEKLICNARRRSVAAVAPRACPLAECSSEASADAFTSGRERDCTRRVANHLLSTARRRSVAAVSPAPAAADTQPQPRERAGLADADASRSTVSVSERGAAPGPGINRSETQQ